MLILQNISSYAGGDKLKNICIHNRDHHKTRHYNRLWRKVYSPYLFCAMDFMETILIMVVFKQVRKNQRQVAFLLTL